VRRGYILTITLSVIFLAIFNLYINLLISLIFAMVFAIFGCLSLYFNDKKSPYPASLFVLVASGAPLAILYINKIILFEIFSISILLVIGASIISYLTVKDVL
jgi:hypothetical protein